MEDRVRLDDDDDDGRGEAATTTGPRTPDCRPGEWFDDEPRGVVGVSPMIMYRGVGEEVNRHESPARVDIPTSRYGGSTSDTTNQPCSSLNRLSFNLFF